MSLGLINYPNIDPPDSDYPDGRTTDNPGNFLGTPVNLDTLGDYQQWFAKIMREAGLTSNGLPDNEYNGFQYLDAALIVFQRYRNVKILSTGQTFTIAPYEQCIIFQQPGALPGGEVALPEMTDTSDGHTVKVVNRDAGETIDITSTDADIDWLGASPYVQPVMTVREYTLNKVLSLWMISSECTLT